MSSGECPEYYKLLVNSLKSLKAQNQLCDVTIIAGDEEIKVHRLILVAASKYFKAMFFNDTQESKTGIIRFPSTLKDVVKQCIEFIYSGKVEYSLKNITETVKTTDMLGLGNLTELYVRFFSKNINLENSVEILSLAHLYDNTILKASIQTFFSTNFSLFVVQKKYVALELDCFTFMLSLANAFSGSFAELKVTAIMNWIKHDRDERRDLFVGLFRTINASTLSKEFIKTRVMCEDFVSDSKECLRTITDLLLNDTKSYKRKLTEDSVPNFYGIDWPNASTIKPTGDLNIKVNNTSQIVSFNGVAGLIPEIGLATFQALTGIFPSNFNSEMDLIYYHGSLYIGTGLEIYKFIDKRRYLYPVDFNKVKRNKKSLTCSSCYKDHWCLGMEENLYRIKAQKGYWRSDTVTLAWTTQTDDSLDSDLTISHRCKNCEKLMEKKNFNTSCYSRCIGIGNSVYMLTMNYVVEYRISTSKLIHHNAHVGLGNGFGIAASNDRIYALGGNGTETKAVAFDLVTFQVIQLPNMAQGCTFGYSFFKDNKLYACSCKRECTKWVHVKTTDSELRDTRQVMKIMHPPAPIHFGRNLLMDMPQAKAMTSSCSGK